MRRGLVVHFERLLVFSPTRAPVERYAAEIGPAWGVPVGPAGDAETVVRESDVVVTATPAKRPILHADWLHPGLHITAMGADSTAIVLT